MKRKFFFYCVKGDFFVRIFSEFRDNRKWVRGACEKWYIFYANEGWVCESLTSKFECSLV